ncbi:uncharacterized protein LOC124153518 [Ischnura elegans]|uniref:uncharacterized protein LOC124153518 n=1 Tax=Ischnura elegans TaxID=197161 RepID=UPI001ED8A66F|nr:uncharacterized protein LOC124153518 [Ischnura elegans]
MGEIENYLFIKLIQLTIMYILGLTFLRYQDVIERHLPRIRRKFLNAIHLICFQAGIFINFVFGDDDALYRLHRKMEVVTESSWPSEGAIRQPQGVNIVRWKINQYVVSTSRIDLRNEDDSTRGRAIILRRSHTYHPS